MVEVLATNPARLFGLGSKGVLEPGRDADIVVWDPDARRTIRQRDLHHTSDFTPFEGRELTGSPVRVLSRGGETGRGRFLERRLG